MDLWLLKLGGNVSGFIETLEDGTVDFEFTAGLNFRLGTEDGVPFATYVAGEVEVTIEKNRFGTVDISGGFAGSGAIGGIVSGTIMGDLNTEGLLSVSGTVLGAGYEHEFRLPGAPGAPSRKVTLIGPGQVASRVVVTEGADATADLRIEINRRLSIPVVVTVEFSIKQHLS